MTKEPKPDNLREGGTPGGFGNQEITLAGAVVREPELRYTPSGFAVLELTVGGTERVRLGAEERPLPFYQPVRLLGKQAERWAEALQPHGGVLVIGRFDFHAWEKDGKPMSKLEVVARRLEAFPLAEHELTPPDARGGRRATWGVNRAWCVGNLTRDAELRYTPQADAVATARVAIQDGERAHFVEVQAWREVAEAMDGWRKGQRVWLEGRLAPDAWTAADGNRRYTLRLEAHLARALERPWKLEEGKGDAGGRSPAGKAEGQGGARPRKVPDIDAGLEDFPPEDDLPF